MSYPRELFSINETTTKENIRAYDARRDKVYDTYYANYETEKIGLRERIKILRQIELDLYGHNYCF